MNSSDDQRVYNPASRQGRVAQPTRDAVDQTCAAQSPHFAGIVFVGRVPHRHPPALTAKDASLQEDSISGDFASNAERDLSVSARRNGLSLSWQGTSSAPAETTSIFAWLSRYAASLFLTITGSIMSALAGYVIRELPGRLRSTSDSAPKA